MSYYIRQGNTYSVAASDAVDITQTLPAANYTVKYSDNRGYYLEDVPLFVDLPRYYGNTIKHAERIMNTFKQRQVSTGVLLTGEKGSGKTLLAKRLSILGYSCDVPTIVINSLLHGEDFNTFLASISQPCIVTFDEFEKVYSDREKQAELLTLFDGTYRHKKLFVLTANDTWGIGEYFKNRPGRIFYSLDFKGLSTEFVKEYCVDNLVNKDHIQSVCDAASVFERFNFDMLQALVEEMNRYDETAHESLMFLNANMESARATYEIKVFYKKELLRQYTSPSLEVLKRFGIYLPTKEDDDHELFVLPSHLVSVNGQIGEYRFEPKPGFLVVATRVAEASVDLSDYVAKGL